MSGNGIELQSETVTIRGTTFTVTELNFGRMTAVLARPREEQNLALVAAAVSNGSGEPLGPRAEDLPFKVTYELLQVASRLNGVEGNQDRGNE